MSNRKFKNVKQFYNFEEDVYLSIRFSCRLFRPLDERMYVLKIGPKYKLCTLERQLFSSI